MQKKLRILIVEDEEAIRTGLADVFVYHGYDVESTADGREGLRTAWKSAVNSRDKRVINAMLSTSLV